MDDHDGVRLFAIYSWATNSSDSTETQTPKTPICQSHQTLIVKWANIWSVMAIATSFRAPSLDDRNRIHSDIKPCGHRFAFSP